jgi:hypothetical protein
LTMRLPLLSSSWKVQAAIPYAERILDTPWVSVAVRNLCQ